MKKGSIYLYTLIICMVILTLLSSVIIINSYNKKIADNYSNNDNLYSLAISSSEVLLEIFKDYIITNNNTINNSFNQNINNIDFNQNSIYILENLNNNYEGNFSCPEILNIYKKTILSLNYPSSYIDELHTNEKDYTLNSNITVDLSQNIILNSMATYNNHRNSVKGKIDFKSNNQSLDLKLKWKNIITPFEYGVYTKGIVTGDFFNTTQIQSGNFSFLNFDLPNHDYDNFNPIIISDSQLDIDVSLINVNTFIFNTSSRDLNIYSSDLSKNNFNGCIISNGNINISSDININGFIYAGNNLNIGNNVNFVYDENAIFNIRCMDSGLYRKLLDELNITSFKNITTLKTINVNLILNNAEIYGLWSIKTFGENDFMPIITDLKKISN